jgi:hypothetical protein
MLYWQETYERLKLEEDEGEEEEVEEEEDALHFRNSTENINAYIIWNLYYRGNFKERVIYKSE